MKANILIEEKATIEHLFVNVIFNEDFDAYFKTLASEINTITTTYNFLIKTIYLTGQSLSSLSLTQLLLLLSLLQNFVSEALIEYSVELAGYSIWSLATFNLFKTFSVNRIVWKVFTFNQIILTTINPNYQVKTILDNIKNGTFIGSFSIDLNYNLPHQTNQTIINDLNQSILLKSSHISYESWTTEESEEARELIKGCLSKCNYQNYEIFSYSKNQETQSQHTLSYLQLKNWYGAGPSSHSFIKTENRAFIISNSPEEKWKPVTNSLSPSQYQQLLLTQGLMLKKGVELNKIILTSNTINTLIKEEMLMIKGNHLLTTKKGWRLLNEVLTVIINNS